MTEIQSMTAIGDYFRTALLIDDRAFDTASDLESAEPAPAGDGEPTAGLVAVQNEYTSVDWNRIVHAFFQEGVVCSVLRPDQGEGILELIIKGSKIADLLILDWDFFDDNGKTTIKAIKEITTPDASRSKALKAIIIYTEMSPDSVTEALVKKCELIKDEESDYVFSKDATIVSVFSKSSIGSMEGEEKSRIASYSKLPAMIRRDLEKYFGGLVPELAFSAVNIIRESTPRILATFNSTLDAPLLTHRALLSDISDAGPQFIRLLTSELEISLMESSLTHLLGDGSIRKRLNKPGIVKDPQKLYADLSGYLETSHHLKQRTASESVIEAVALGFHEIGLKEDALKDRPLKRMMNQLVECFGVGTGLHESLAVLMSSHQFGQIPPRLEAGIVVKRDERYWLCIQPLCDSVRLTKSRKFPLLPLIINVNEDGSIKNHSAAMIWAVNSVNSKAIPVRFSSSIYDLEMPEFDPKGNSFVEAQEENGAWWFEDMERKRYRAVCRLRGEFTQQAVQGLTLGVARPGVDSSEWLRRSGRG